mgnify:CR=1 FL=1
MPSCIATESKNLETLEKYGLGTPDDWIERNVYTPFSWQGCGLMLVVNLALFGPIGATIWAVQMAWIPVTAAGIINGIGHYWGYRNFSCEDASRNVVPWGILIGGEELHNNHHAYGTSAKLSSRWYEFDIGWMYIRVLEMLGLATVRKGRAAPEIRQRQAPCRFRDAAGGDHPPLRRACQLRTFVQRDLRPRSRELARARPAWRADPEVPSFRRVRAVVPIIGERAARTRSRQAGVDARKQQSAAHDLRHAPGAGSALGAFQRIARATVGALAGLVSPRGRERHRAAAELLATAAELRVIPETETCNKKARRMAGFTGVVRRIGGFTASPI